ncbi:glutathione S-transferase C-terminal-like protein, partial [Protomyces lactucae-debilis]
VTLYSHQGGPNGWKVATVLNELGLKYRTIFIDFKKGDHRKEEFLRLCPNARIPLCVFHRDDDFAVWESGAILLYLVQHYDPNYTLWSRDRKEQSQITSWIMLQVSGHGVIQGQAFWFKFFHHEAVESATRRYIDETRRVYGVLEVRLAEAREELWDHAEREDVLPEALHTYPVWLVGSSMTIADLSYLTWARTAHRLDIDLEQEFPEVGRWVDNMLARPKVAEAL